MQKFKTIFINSLPVIDEVICNESTAHLVPCDFFSIYSPNNDIQL